MGDIKAPARNPCGSCPYRRDVPSGVWAEEEYAKLPLFDGETFEQPPSVFLCHQQNGRLCAGWVGCHDMEQSFGLRMASMTGQASPEVINAALDYETSTPLFASGSEAAEHGRARIENPDLQAMRTVQKVERRQDRVRQRHKENG